MTLPVLVVALLAVCYALSKSTDILVMGINQLSKGTRFEKNGFTKLFVALATSLPELFVGISAALRSEPEIALGTVLGSNIVNVSLVIGLAAVVSGSIKAKDEIYSKDILQAFLIGSLPLLLLLDKQLSRFDGVILLLVYVVYSWKLLKSKHDPIQQVEQEYFQDHSLSHRILNLAGKKEIEHGLGKFLLGSLLLLGSAEVVVRLTEYIAQSVNIPIIVVALFMVSVGTSLPELAFEIKTVAKREYLMAFGNIVGSTIVNASLILGVTALLAPIFITPSMGQTYLLSVIAFVIVSVVFWLMTFTKKSLERWEGGVLSLLYFVFVLVQMQVN